MDLVALALACAPYVALDTARALVQVESGFDALAIHVNGARLERQPRSLAEAAVTARALHAQGWSFDIGLAQINVRTAARLGVSLEQVFDPCTNLRLMQRILQECFARAGAQAPAASARLDAALSCYNTGDLISGRINGYVDRVVAAARGRMPRDRRTPAWQPAAGFAPERDGRLNEEQMSK